MKELTVEATIANVQTVTDFVNDQLEANGCPMKVQVQLDVAIDELFSNIAYYAYTPATGTATVQVEFTESPRAVRLTFVDSGTPYNPLDRKDPDVTLSVEERGIGGLGIFMVKKTMDELLYEHRDGCNRLTVVKSWN